MDFFLTKTYFVRYLHEGRIYLITGIVIPVFVLMITMFVGVTPQTYSDLSKYSSGTGISNVGLLSISILIPYLIPLFSIVGSIGVPAIFSEDRSNGFYEFVLSSTKIGTKEVFWAVIITSVAITGLILAIVVAMSVSLFQLRVGFIPGYFLKDLAIYSVPISIMATFLVASVTFISQALTKRISYVNSPAGLAPIFGIIMTIIPLEFSLNTLGSQSPGGNPLFLELYLAASAALVVFIFILATRRIVRERFLP